MKNLMGVALGAAISGGLAVAPVSAPLAADFYEGKTLSIFVGVSPGGLYSTFAQIASRHLGQYIPGKPTVVVQHMPGAGGTKAVSYVYSVAAKDGTVAITPNSSVDKRVVLKIGNPKYDPSKMHWLGGWGEAVFTLSLRKDIAPAMTLEETKTKEVVLGAIGKTSNPYMIPAMLKNLYGSKFKIITGYRGGSPIRKAVETGEVQGWCGQYLGWQLRKPDWLRDGKLVHLVQLASEKHPDLLNVPLLSEFAKDDEEREMFRFIQTGITDRAMAVAPGVPDDKAKIIQTAYFKMLADPKFLADAKKFKYRISPIPGEKIQAFVNKMMAMNPKTVEKIRRAMGLIK
jgi:tripartite-type tricarboxylate transporter receptor subunit TctC